VSFAVVDAYDPVPLEQDSVSGVVPFNRAELLAHHRYSGTWSARSAAAFTLAEPVFL
jgi:hypothetical protein